MAFGSSSAIFVQAMLNPIAGRCWTTAAPGSYGSLSADTINCALFPDSVTPDKNATQANTCYGAGTWTGALSSSTQWPAVGVALSAGKAFAINIGSAGANVVSFDANDVSGSGNVTISGAMGCLIYDDTVATPADIGLCFLAFGSAQGVAGGTFTVVFDATGVFKISV